MNDHFPLPLECLRLILKHFASQRDLNTLSALLRTSKYVCLATLPYLYSNPFSFFIPTESRGVFFAMTYNCPRIRAISRNLLASVPDEECPGIVKAMYGQPTSQPWPIDYLSYLEHFQSQTNKGISLLTDLSLGQPLPAGLGKYIDDHDLVAEYRARAPATSYGYEFDLDPSSPKESANILGHLNLDIHRELSWTLCSRVPEQLKSIVIPLSDIDQYLDLAPQMTSLQSVTFRMDEVADTDNWWSVESFTADQMDKLAMVKTKRLEDLESAVEFVLLHTLLYPGLLAHVACVSFYSPNSEQVCPDSFYRRMAGAIKVRSKPTELTDNNWREFTVNVENTDLSQVTVIYVYGRDRDWYRPLQATPFLHLCTSLQAYVMMSLGPDSFKWAVKKDAGVLPPLRMVDIEAIKEPFGSELNDIGLAFGNTLEALRATGYRPQDDAQTDELNIQTIAIGSNWNTPVLKSLSVQMGSERLVLDPKLLACCPNLRRLDLRDSIDSYDVREIHTYQPCKLPELTKLFLSGTPGLAFHPDTLHSTKALKTLVLGSHSSFNQTFLPSVHRTLGNDHVDTLENGMPLEDLVHRPKWTWDWFLPQLVTLDLSLEFALPFQFRMLQATPSLQNLHLTLLSNMPALERVLTDADFIVPPSTHSAHFPPPQGYLSMIPPEDLDQIFLRISDLKRDMEHLPELSSSHELSSQPFIPELLSDNQQLQQRHSGLLWRHREYIGRHAIPQGDPEQGYARNSHELHAMVAAAPLLQRVLDTLLAARAKYCEKQATQAAIVAVLQAEQPERLMVPSLKTLELNGRWVILDEVLEIMLGQVFVHAETVDLFGCVGFSTHTWVGATGTMPFLQRATVNRVLEADTMAECGLQRRVSQVYQRPALFETETRKRLEYAFLDGTYTFAEGAAIAL